MLLLAILCHFFVACGGGSAGFCVDSLFEVPRVLIPKEKRYTQFWQVVFFMAGWCCLKDGLNFPRCSLPTVNEQLAQRLHLKMVAPAPDATWVSFKGFLTPRNGKDGCEIPDEYQALGTWWPIIMNGLLWFLYCKGWYCWWFRNPKQPPGLYQKPGMYHGL